VNREVNRPDLFVQIEDLVEQSKLELLVKQNLPNLLISNLISPPLIGLITGFKDEAFYHALAWTVFGLVLGCARLLHHQELAKFQSLGKSTRQWEFELVIFSMLNGFFWAAACILFINTETPGISIVIVATVFAHISASVAGLSTHPLILNAFTCALWIPTSVYFISMQPGGYQWFYLQMAVLGAFFVIVNTIYAVNQGRAVISSLRLRYENQHLPRELRQQKMIAENADLAKSRFLAAASHDLRQPLHAMSLFADSLNQRIQSSESREILNKLRISMDSLKGLFNSLLDISRLDAEVITPEYSTFHLGRLLDQLINEYQTQASNKNLEIRKRMGDYWVFSDPVLVEQILRNLIWNAIKYTETGGVLVALRKQDTRISAEVWDTGVGISDEEQLKIFDEFHQINNPGRDRSQGIGLGLSIFQRTAKLLGLDLSLASRPGSGSRFGIDFRQVPEPITPEEREQTFPLDLDLSGVSVLIVDDSEDIRASLSLRMRDLGCQVETAGTLENVTRVLDFFSPDILLTDFQLQYAESGGMVIKLVRETLGVEVPCIIITGTTMAETSNISHNQDIEILYKPVQSDEIREAMIRALNH
jgi:two-component system, sensor histidine kinase